METTVESGADPPDVERMKARGDTAGLIRALSYGGSARIRQEAARALGDLSTPSLLEPLLALNTSNEDADWDAVERPAQTGAGSAVEPLIAALADENAEVRSAAIKALGQIGDPRAVEPLSAMLGEHPYVTANAMARIGASSVELLVTALKGSGRNIRCAAAWALGTVGDTRALGPLSIALGDEDQDVGRAAAGGVRQIISHTAGPLVRAVEENRETHGAEEEIVRCLGNPHTTELLMVSLVTWTNRCTALGGQATDPISLAGIADAYQNSDRASRAAAAAAYALGAIGDEGALSLLVSALRDEEAGVRRAAAWALGRIGDARAVVPLVAALGDRERDVRGAAAEALDQLGWKPEQNDDGARYWLARGKREERTPSVHARGGAHAPCAAEALFKLLEDGTSEERWEVVRALGESGDPRALEPLIAALEDEDDNVRRAAIDALGRTGEARAVPPLLARIRRSGHLSWRAARALANIRDACAVEPLLRALEVDDRDVRGAAALALGGIGDARAAESLVAALRDRNSVVRREAAEALDKLGWEAGQSPHAPWYWVAKQDWRMCMILGEAALEALLFCLQDADTCEASASALEGMGWAPGPDEDGVWYWAAREEWGQCADLGAVAVEPLLVLLAQESSPSRRRRIAEALVGLYERLPPDAKAPILAARPMITDIHEDMGGKQEGSPWGCQGRHTDRNLGVEFPL